MSPQLAAPASSTDWYSAVRARPRLGGSIEIHNSIGSTSDRAAELLAEPEGDGCVVLAEEQRAGRGRRGRTWLSPPGRNLTLSVGLRPRLRGADAWRLGLAASLAVRGAAASATAKVMPNVALKWPNDLVAAGDGAKLGGLLVETVLEGERVASAVVGIGINVNWRMRDMPAELAERATSLADLAGREIDRVALLDSLLDALDDEITAVEAGRSPLARYRAACVTLGTSVVVATADGRVEGRAVDLDDHGSLVMETATGRVVLASGEVLRVATGDRP